jgi:hypothetical protein
MSLVSAVFGTDDDEEILGHLGALINVRVFLLLQYGDSTRMRLTGGVFWWRLIEHRGLRAYTRECIDFRLGGLHAKLVCGACTTVP